MDREFLVDLFAGFGPVTIRRMFSGFGISADGINFALALRSGLYLRVDEENVAAFEAAGSKPFQYQTRARTMTVGSYWEVPAHLFDDVEEFAEWARAALAAAQRAALKKRSRVRKPAIKKTGTGVERPAAKTASGRLGSGKTRATKRGAAPPSRKSKTAKAAARGGKSGRKGSSKRS
ncbi:conserved hypothetical protein [Bradyrhizobium sp. STM 3843]|uniref:TfoX/Sxy family protein n=1 Tax=Bradyrhizobium sp. STM 3843 TaxID=551947 RepID=UPI0002404F9F|nr:TfoX/Sxy family protein [Bradyrhizobium sp. STM 3843]CCE08724.1 conserved hypothetical protein [Bradyrhizobium sp. STM 3843]